MRTKNPTKEELSAVFEYKADAERRFNGFHMRGGLVRKRFPRRDITGTLTCCPKSRPSVGYRGKLIYIPVVIWILHHDTIPAGFYVDHIDGDPSNNRIENLRLLTVEDNQMNRRSSRQGASCKYIGVSVSGKKFSAYGSAKSKPIYLGTFSSAKEAAAARDAWVLANKSSSARLNMNIFPKDFA